MSILVAVISMGNGLSTRIPGVPVEHVFEVAGFFRPRDPTSCFGIENGVPPETMGLPQHMSGRTPP